MANILIIYASTSGNTELTCEKVADVLREKANTVTLQRAELSKVEDIFEYDLSILASPTYGQGALHKQMVPLAMAMKSKDFSGQKFALIGLGDAKYDLYHNIESEKILKEIIKNSGGELITDSLKIIKSPIPFLETNIKKWTELLAEKL